jgi:demethylmenaquinone methyltransferase/2-methoxy-6-polyprenyl-1,4-benzoquinol methylase
MNPNGLGLAYLDRGGPRSPPHDVVLMAHVESAAASPRKRHALGLFEGLPARYDRTGAVMSFGQDPRWRAAMVDAVDPQPGQRILDVATGTGMVARALARRGATVTALDQSEAMLNVARARDHPGITFVHGEAERLPFADASFDALTFTYLLRYVDDPAATLTELARVVIPGGRIGMVEFGVPGDPALRRLWRLHTRAGLPLIGRLLSPAWYEVGRFLGPSIEQFHAARPDLAHDWRRAGIDDVHALPMSFGAGLVMWGVRDDDRA